MDDLVDDSVSIPLSPETADFLLNLLNEGSTVSSDHVVANGEQDDHRPCSCPAIEKLNQVTESIATNPTVVTQGTNSVLGEPKPEISQRFQGSGRLLAKPPSLIKPRGRTRLRLPRNPCRISSTFLALCRGQSEVTTPHHSSEQSSSSPTKKEQSEVTTPHHSSSHSSFSFPKATHGQSEVTTPHQSSSHSSFSSPKATRRQSEVTTPHHSSSHSSSSSLRATRGQSEVITPHHSSCRSISSLHDPLPSFPDPVGNLQDPVKPPVKKIRKTRRAGRKNQLRALLRGYSTAVPSPTHQVLFPAPKALKVSTQAGPREPYEPTHAQRTPATAPSVQRPKPRIVRVEHCKRYRILSYRLQPLDLPPVIYPADIRKDDPRYEVYIRKRAQALYPLPPL